MAVALAVLFALWRQLPVGAGKVEPAARALSDEGMVAFQRQDYDRAIELFQQSYELLPKTALLFDIAQARRRKGDCAGALADYRRYLDLEPQAPNRATVMALMQEMEACAAVPASPPAPAAAAPAPSPSPPPPLPPPAPALAPVEAHLASPAPIAPTVSLRGGRTIGLAMGAAGVMALGLAVFYNVQAVRESDRISQLFRDGGQWTPMDDERLASSANDRTTARILYTTAAVALVAGGILYYMGARRPEARASF